MATGAFVVGAAREQLLDETARDSAGIETDIQMITPSPHLRRQCPIAAEGIGQKAPRWVNFAQRVVNTAPGRHTGGRAARRGVISESTSYFAARKTSRCNGRARAVLSALHAAISVNAAERAWNVL